MKERIVKGHKLRKEILETSELLCGAVKSTLGPMGTNFGVLDLINLPDIINDGATVANSIKFEDPLKQYIANIIKTVSKNTDSLADDGTTTSLTLTDAILKEGIKYINAGFRQIDLVTGYQKASKEIISLVESKIIPVTNELLNHVATISANNDPELGKVISDAFIKVGVDGQVEIVPSKTNQTYFESIGGMTYNSGYEHNLFVNEPIKQTCKFENPSLLIFEGKINSVSEQLQEVLTVARNNNQPIIILADEFDPTFINDLTYIKLNNHVKVAAVRSPSYGKEKVDNLSDISFISGATTINKEQDIDVSILGQLDSAVITKDTFTLVSDTDTKERASLLKEQLKEVKGNEKDELQKRIARLNNGIGTLFVGGSTPMEVSEKIYRVEDAINATRGAMEMGILPGGGITLLKIAKEINLPDLNNTGEELGFKLLLTALEAPIRTILENGGIKPDLVIDQILKQEDFNYGYDLKNDKFGNLVDLGVIDPAKVTLAAFKSACSVSEMILRMNGCIY